MPHPVIHTLDSLKVHRAGFLDEFDLISFRGIHERDASPIRAQVRSVRVFVALAGEVHTKILQTVHFKRDMSQIGLDLHRTTLIILAKLNGFVTFRCFHKHQFRAARGFVPAHFLQAQNVLVKFHSFVEVIHPVAGVQ